MLDCQRELCNPRTFDIPVLSCVLERRQQPLEAFSATCKVNNPWVKRTTVWIESSFKSAPGCIPVSISLAKRDVRSSDVVASAGTGTAATDAEFWDDPGLLPRDEVEGSLSLEESPVVRTEKRHAINLNINWVSKRISNKFRSNCQTLVALDGEWDARKKNARSLGSYNTYKQTGEHHVYKESGVTEE